MDGDILFDMRHMSIFPWISWKEIKWRKKNIFRAIYLLFLDGITSDPSKYQLRALGGWTHAVWYATWLYFIEFSKRKKWHKKNTFWRRKITSPAVFLLYLVAVTSNLANYQLGALDGWRYTVWYVTLSIFHWISWKEIKWRRKNIFRAVFSAFF